MKNMLLLYTALIIISIPAILRAQNPSWLEVGSEWTYQYGHCCGPEHYQVKYGITEETTFAGKVCAKMEKIPFGASGINCVPFGPPYYFYVSNDSLFIASDALDEFRLAFDFGAEPGDSWQYKAGVDDDVFEYTITVNSVETINIGGIPLRQLNITYDFDIETDGEAWFLASIYPETMVVTEVIGAHHMFFVPLGYAGFCHDEANVQLQCFESPSFSYINPVYPACDFITSIEALEERREIHLFPNPAGSWVRIDGQAAGQVHRVEVYNLSGQLVHSHTLQQTGNGIIDVSALPSGMYVVHAHQSGRVMTAKFVKE